MYFKKGTNMPNQKRKSIPTFASEDAERDFWAKNDSVDFIDWSKAKKVTLTQLHKSRLNSRAPENGTS